jgi:hypothetical protein
LKGRKRHLAVDTQGLLLGVVVHAADIQDADGHCQFKAIRNEFRQLSCAEAAQSARLRVYSGAFTKDNCVGESVRGSS